MKDAAAIEAIAAACHAAWYAYTVMGLGEPGEEWHVAPTWQKDSIRNAVAFWMELGPEEPNTEALVTSTGSGNVWQLVGGMVR